MSFIKLLLMLFKGQSDPEIVDHTPIKRHGNVAAKKLENARKKAAERHGKKFHAQVIHPRETPPSRALLELQDANKEQPEQSIAKRRIGK